MAQREKTIKSISIHCNEEEILLSNMRCAFWKKEQTLILSDMHLGKSAHFRKNGISIPSAVLDDDLLRLAMAIEYFNAHNVIIVGDMFHYDYNTDIEKFYLWQQKFNHIKWILIEGNHDRLTEKIYKSLNIEVVKNCYEKRTFIFSHKPCKHLGYVVSGHIHPGVVINGKANQRIKLPCFVQTNEQLILPAFSAFTGLDLHTIYSRKEATFFAFTSQMIFKV